MISAHLVSLKDQLSKYFSDISSENWLFKLVRDPFNTDVDRILLPEYLQEHTIGLKNDSKARTEYSNMNVEDFCLCYLPIYPEVAKVEKLLVQFSSIYLCWSGFSTLAHIKSKHRARLDVDSDLRCALSQMFPNIKNLIKNKQCQPSH